MVRGAHHERPCKRMSPEPNFFYKPSSSRMGGQQFRHGLAASKAADALNTIWSSKCRPMICKPTGSPSLVQPAGMDAAG